MTAPPALLLIDYQKGFEVIAASRSRNNPEAESNVMRLLEAWREAGWPVLHVRHDSKEPGSPLAPGTFGNAAMSFAAERPGEPVVRKVVNSAFIGTDLEARLIALGRPEVVMAGVTTDHCVSTSVRHAANLGFVVVLAADACFTFDRRDTEGETIAADLVHRVAVASLAGEFATVTCAAVLVQRALAAPR
ncbi:MAG: cysteine hydrolase family protein [Hyphomicrobiaceae bacterium]